MQLFAARETHRSSTDGFSSSKPEHYDIQKASDNRTEDKKGDDEERLHDDSIPFEK